MCVCLCVCPLNRIKVSLQGGVTIDRYTVDLFSHWKSINYMLPFKRMRRKKHYQHESTHKGSNYLLRSSVRRARNVSRRLLSSVR